MINSDHLCVLGTGTSVPEPGIYPSSYMISNNNKLTLVDAGHGISQQIVSLGYSLKSIQNIIVTHIHSDHTLGIPEILMGILNDERISKYTVNICISSDYINFIKKELLNPWNKWICRNEKITINIIPLKANKTEIINSIQIKPFIVNHHPSSLGLMMKTEGKFIVFTGDTDIFDIGDDIEKVADIIFIDSTTVDNYKIKGHLTVLEAINLLKNTRIPEVYITHMLPQYRQEIIKYIEIVPKSKIQCIQTAFEGQIIPLK